MFLLIRKMSLSLGKNQLQKLIKNKRKLMKMHRKRHQTGHHHHRDKPKGRGVLGLGRKSRPWACSPWWLCVLKQCRKLLLLLNRSLISLLQILEKNRRECTTTFMDYLSAKLTSSPCPVSNYFLCRLRRSNVYRTICFVAWDDCWMLA